MRKFVGVLAWAALAPVSALAQDAACKRYGAMEYCTEGPGFTQFGNTTYYNNGLVRQDNGDSARYSDGFSINTYGNTTYYSNGVTRQSFGTMDIYSNGRYCQTIGNMRFCQ